MAIVSVSLGKLDLQRGIALGPLRVRTDEITKQQGKLLAEAPRPPDVDVGALASRRLAEVSLRPLRVVCAKDVAEALERRRKASSGSNAATEICTSKIGLAARPGTAVDPM